LPSKDEKVDSICENSSYDLQPLEALNEYFSFEPVYYDSYKNVIERSLSNFSNALASNGADSLQVKLGLGFNIACLLDCCFIEPIWDLGC